MTPLLVATLIWASVVVFTITIFVPLNNKIAALNTGTLNSGWQDDHKRWDFFHRIRILALTIALLILTPPLVA